MEKTIKFQQKLLAVSVLSGLLSFTTTGFAAPDDGAGGGGGAGQGGGQGEIFGDLVKLLRDANGVPIVSADGCQQPIDANGAPIPLDPATCAVLVGSEDLLQEVDFARLSVARSPDTVMEKQLEDVLVNLTTAQCLSLDPAGRLAYSNPDTLDADGDGNTTELVANEVDSPLQNLAIYRQLITNGVLGNPAIALPKPFSQYGILDTAAKALGAAADKGGKIDVDLVVYLNQIMGLDKVATQLDPKICIDVKEEVQGVVQMVNKCFLNYGAYAYSRSQTYGNLPYPKNIPAANPTLGFFDYLTPHPTLLAADNRPLFFIDSAGIVPTVFLSLPGFSGGNIGGFAQASDDARAVIDFMHNHPVLEGYEAPVLCPGTAPTPGGSTATGSAVINPQLAVANQQLTASNPRCKGIAATLVGTPGADRLVGTAARDIIVGLAGNDIINGGGGNDLVCAGRGNDTVFGGTGNDRLLGEGGNDNLIGGEGRDYLEGGAGKNRCIGEPGRDTGTGCERPSLVPRT